MFTIKIADLCVEIDNIYRRVYASCYPYLTEETPDFRVRTTQEKILAERSVSKESQALGYCESVCLYREIAQHLPDYHAFLFHASVIDVDGCCYAFAAKSGTGKSTHTNLWLQHFGDRARIVNGDKPILRWLDGRLYAFGTPWNGKERLGSNIRSPLRAICFLERGEENAIRRASHEESVRRIFHQTIMPTEPERLNRFLEDVERMIETVPAYILRCNISDEAVTTAYRAMCGKEEWIE